MNETDDDDKRFEICDNTKVNTDSDKMHKTRGRIGGVVNTDYHEW